MAKKKKKKKAAPRKAGTLAVERARLEKAFLAAAGMSLAPGALTAARSRFNAKIRTILKDEHSAVKMRKAVQCAKAAGARAAQNEQANQQSTKISLQSFTAACAWVKNHAVAGGVTAGPLC